MASPNVTFLAFFVALALSALHTDAAAAAETLHHRSDTWCVAKPSTQEAALRGNLEFACSESDCGAIQGTGGCAQPDSLLSRASVAMNAYYQARGRNSWNCFFNGTGIITITDPSLGTCKYA
ncbi:putative X8 domain containing family protein isoform 2 precursor [Zea mays]|uniref:X8 domain-containing protein n=1 Tax=Zea mays TaxID=4577 RepID=B4FR19_MAIZE|nr:putative X8 domain containing family protein precursor 2 precursor [Zea mays]ACF84562.1 unknown [Zea mays]